MISLEELAHRFDIYSFDSKIYSHKENLATFSDAYVFRMSENVVMAALNCYSIIARHQDYESTWTRYIFTVHCSLKYVS